MSKKTSVSLLVAQSAVAVAICLVCIGIFFGWFMSVFAFVILVMLAISGAGVAFAMVRFSVGRKLGAALLLTVVGVVTYVAITYGWLSVFGLLAGLTVLVMNCAGLDGGSSSHFDDDDFSPRINPATGLPMINGGRGGVDVGGNTYGSGPN